MKRAIIYARVSTDEQRGNYSIPSQVKECCNYINQKGYVLVGNKYVDPETGFDADSGIKAFVDDYSSLEMSRPGIDNAYEYLRTNGFDIVVVLTIDRLDRDPVNLQIHERKFELLGAEVEYVQLPLEKNPSADFIKTIFSGAAKLENDMRTERMNRGKRQKALSGLFVGGRAPYGYQIDKSKPGGLAIVDSQADAVRLIFDAYCNKRLSIYEVVDFMNDSEYKPSLGERWAKSSVQKILSNEAYIGTVHYNKFRRKGKGLILRDPDDWIEISILPIIDKGLFALAQERLKENLANRRKQPQRFYLLSGFIFCEECGKAYVAGTNKAGTNRRKNDNQYYRHRKSQGHCSNQTITARIIEPIVWQKLEEILLDPETLRRGYDEAKHTVQKSQRDQRGNADKLQKDIDKLEKSKSNLLDAYIDPDIQMSKHEYNQKNMSIELELCRKRERLNSLQEQVASLPTLEELEDLERFSKKVKELLTSPDWNPTPENIRHIYQLLQIKVFLGKDGTGRIEGWFQSSEGLSFTTY